MKLSAAFLICHLLAMAVAEGQPVPSITSISPSSGSPETPVVINGTDFSAVPEENTVYFGPVKAVVSSASESQLNVIVPFGATSQPVSVTVDGLTASSPS